MCDRYGRIRIEPSMMLYEEVDLAIRRVPYGLYSLIGPLDSVPVDTVVVRSKRIKLQRGISHAGEFLGPRSELFWSDAPVVPEQFGTRAKKFSGMGYTAKKFDPFGSHYDSIDRNGIERAYERVKAVRDATNGKVDLLIEHHGRFDPNSAIAIAHRLQEFDPLFMEEPVHPDNLEGLRKYREATDVRIAVGERILTKEQAAYIISNNLADYMQADITNMGGVTVARKVAAIAEAYGVEMAFHNAFGPVQNAVTIQVDAALPNFLIQESFYDCFPDWKRRLVKDQSKIEDGYTTVPTRPGLGVEVDEKVLEDHRAEGQEYFNPDEPVWVVKDTWKD